MQRSSQLYEGGSLGEWSQSNIGINHGGWGCRDPQILGWGSWGCQGWVVKHYYILSCTEICSKMATFQAK